MYVRVSETFGESNVLIKDPSIYYSPIYYTSKDKLYNVVIENECLAVLCFCIHEDEINQVMKEMTELRYNQVNGSPSDVINFYGFGIKVISKSDKVFEEKKNQLCRYTIKEIVSIIRNIEELSKQNKKDSCK